MQNRTFFIAITGVMGAGKSAFSSTLSNLGLKVLDSDKIAKNILFENEDVKREVRKLLGDECFDNDNMPITKNIANIVFNDSEKLASYEKIIHPYVRLSWQSQARSEKLCAVEVPLLFEKNLQVEFDMSVCVFVSETLRKKRLLKRGMSEADIISRDAFQLTQSEKIIKSDVAIFNEGSLDFLTKQAKILLSKFNL